MPGLNRGVLILGGTGEARSLAAALHGWRVVSSLAGRVNSPTLPVGQVRIGGFGGPEALAAWLVAERIGAVVDATHPFAARITASAVQAAPIAGVPLLLLRRPGWTAGPGDDWCRVPTVPAAAEALRALDGPVLLTTGRGGLTSFADLPHRFVVRTVDPPDPPLPRDVETILDRGPYTLEGELDLMRRHAVRVLVTKDSGGDMTVAKLVAARELGVRVVMVDRPVVAGSAGVPSVRDVAGAVAWLDSIRSGFHAGELEIQRRAGVTADAAPLERLLAPADLTDCSGRALRGMTFAVLTGTGTDGLRWVSPLHGPPGFLSPMGRSHLEIQAVPRPGDPLANLPVGQPVGLIALDFPAARRVRVNGTLAASHAGLRIDAEQAFVNCPQHISPHEVRATTADVASTASAGATLTAGQTRFVQAAATFFLGTAHPDRGADVSHKGGAPGVVRVDGEGLWWPDFAGNNMFNSFGNLLSDPSAALLFVDFASGDTLHLSGTAEVEWSRPGDPDDDEATGRRVRFTPVRVIEVENA